MKYDYGTHFHVQFFIKLIKIELPILVDIPLNVKICLGFIENLSQIDSRISNNYTVLLTMEIRRFLYVIYFDDILHE